MGNRHNPSSIAALRHIEKNGSANYLEIDMVIGGANGFSCIKSLRQNEYIKALPKARGRLKRYAITDAGRRLLFAETVEKEQRLTSFKMPVWVPHAWTLARPGASNAMLIKSRGV